MECRTGQRHSIQLEVVVIDKSFQSWVFTMIDFEVGGIYLSCNQGVPDSIHVNDLLELQFKDNEKEIKQSYSIKIKVLRKLEQALAIEIYNPAYEALLHISKAQQEEAEQNPITDSKVKDIYSHLEKRFISDLSDCIGNFISSCNDHLFTSAKKSRNNSEQTFFFDAINTLNHCKADLKDEFLSLLLNKLNLRKHDLSSGAIPDSTGKQTLELVEQNEYENQLLINDMINSSTLRYKEHLSDIEQHLVSLLSVESDEPDCNLFYPDIIYTSFNESVHHYFTDNKTSEILCKEFEKSVNKTLPDAYNDLNQIFIDNGVVKVINKKQLEVKKSESDSSATESKTKETKKDQSTENNDKELSAEKTGEGNNTNNTNNTGNRSNSGNINNIGNTFKYATEIATLENNINLNNAYQSLKDILSFQTKKIINQTSDKNRHSIKYLQEINNLVDELTVLQQTVLSDTQTDIDDLPQLVMAHISKQNYSSDALIEIEQTLDIMGRLFFIINHDEWLTPEIKKLFVMLRLPLIKIALLNKDFFVSCSNPARMLVNKLAMLNFNDSNDQSYLNAKSYIGMITKHYDKDMLAFHRAQERLNELLYLQSKQFDQKIEEISNNWNTRQEVSQLIAKNLADKSISMGIADFISNQWMNVLLHTDKSKADNSVEWQQYTQVLQMFVMSGLDGLSAQNIETQTILFIIKKGLSNSGIYSREIVDKLELLFHRPELDKSVMLTEQQIFQLLMNDYSLSDKSALKKITLQTSDSNLSNINRICNYQINDCLIYRQRTKNLRLQLSWKSDDNGIFVMMERNCHKTIVLNLTEMLFLQEHGKIIQTHHFDLPLLERSLYSVMSDVHGKLIHNNRIDPVTKYMLRPEFEQCFTKRLRDTDNKNFSLCMINIDRFSLVNNTFGFECGDHYLSTLANHINQILPDGTLIAHYGTSEFILLFNNLNEEQLKNQAENIRETIQNFNFEWEDNSFSLTASIGVTLAQVNSTSMNKLINAASTAMSLAKEQGRNKVFFFTEDDAGLNYRQQLQIWATKVELMIEQQQLSLSLQRIQPFSSDATPHYEVLLVIKDQEGNPFPPSAFIQAAELYNKMELVDQWVIDQTLSWCQQNPSYFEKIGDISINLSGHSLNSIELVDYVSEKFIQYDIDPSRICFEITETVAIANLDCAIDLVKRIKKLGCKFALDDFGTGMSSYAYLKKLPVDYLKIDGTFIKDIVTNKTDQAIVKSINEIGHFLGIETIAEYVENDEIIAMLKTIGVDYLQGFGVEKPIMMSDF